RDILIIPLSKVSSIVEKKHTLPILSNLLLEGIDKTLKFTVTDLEMQISLSIKINLEEEFKTTLSARKLFDITRALPENSQLEFKIEDSKIIVKAARSRFNLQTLPVKDYPVMQKDSDKATVCSISQKSLKNILKQVDFSMAQQDIRYYLNGLLFEVDGKKLNIIGTDGHRLSFSSCDLNELFDKTQTIVPRKTILELIKLLSDTEDVVKVSIGKNQINFKFNEIDLISKVIEGQFPDYHRVIPEGHKNIFVIDRQQLLSSMQRASILSNEKYRGIRMLVEKNNLKLISTNGEQEKAEEELEIEYTGDPIDIGFNVTYLIDVLTNIQFDRLSFAFNDSNSSCLVTIPNNSEYKYVVMPMRI
ncbi:MAG: DNA polymerase III subunit beta, partial [Methylophilaceae bacterium]